MRAQEQLMFDKGYLTALEAAQRLGMTPVSVYRLVERQGVKIQRAGKRIYIHARSLASFFTEAPDIRDAILVGIDAPDEDEQPRRKRRKA